MSCSKERLLLLPVRSVQGNAGPWGARLSALLEQDLVPASAALKLLLG